ncbi:energy transducer TonB [Porphyrobacter sp. AAP60]|uniref:energy transducer TonB n=1 Tax=Porphyrobacter sp. AAP60 TaxID=1523423 RepID=UPI0006B8D7F5|nr:energy transducer TonB [Porphyrobacter sp. AAP60]KPF63622.1 energy transducer TonB [Porphyrobacter sp. AAP60]
MSYASQQQGLTGPKLVSLIIALAIVGSVGLGMVVFLAVDAVKEMVERVTTVEVKEEEPPPPPDEPPPPEEVPEQTSPPPPVAPPPPFDIAPNPPEVKSVPIPPPPQPVNTQASNVAPPGPPTPPAPPAPSKARGARTKNERSWAARIQENYPARALREETEGTVGVRVTVTADGRATGCSVTASSGSSILDQAACVGMERYSRFEPALDAAGNPTSGSYTTRITYRLN